MNLVKTSLYNISNHRDLRCGLGLIQFQKVMNEFVKLGVPTVKLGSVLSFEYGSSLTEEERSGGEFPVMGSNGIVGYHDDFLVEAPCIIIGRKGSAGEVVYSEKACYPIDTTFYVHLKTDEYDLKFIYYILRLLKLQRLSLFKGVPGLNRFDAYEANIPLVSKSCQKDIISLIRPIELQIEKLQDKINNPAVVINKVFANEFGFDYESILLSHIDKSFTGSFKEIANYQSLRTDYKFRKNMPIFDKLLESVGNYLYLKDINLSAPMYGANEQGIDGTEGIDTRFIRITDIDALGNLIKDDWKTAETIEDKYILKDRDFLFARSGNTVGKSFMYDIEKHPEAFFAGYFIRYELDFSNILPLFLLFYTKSFLFDFWRNAIIRVKGQPNINADEFLTLKIPVLPKKRQEHIIYMAEQEISKMDVIKKQIEQKRAEIDIIILETIMKQY